MDITIHPGPLKGTVKAIPSKSQAHRLLICAAFADKETELICPDTNRDIEATADCLTALGAQIFRTSFGYHIIPVRNIPTTAELNCCESGSTLRFMLPIVGALGVDAIFHMEGRLPKRPLSPLWEEMERMGCHLSRPGTATLRCYGQLKGGHFQITGNISSQFITGLLFAAPLLKDDSYIEILGQLESEPYVVMTLDALKAFGVEVRDQYHIISGQNFHSPGRLTVEGDWSNGAFFLAAQSLGNPVTTHGLNQESSQGDRAAAFWLQKLTQQHCTINAADIPDLVPILSVVAGCFYGACFTNIQRLRLKETDRVATVSDMLLKLGAFASATEDTLVVHPAHYNGCTIHAQNDHRIAMAAAIAATKASGSVTILNAECVNKSYPRFWEEYRRLGGNYEQYIR